MSKLFAAFCILLALVPFCFSGYALDPIPGAGVIKIFFMSPYASSIVPNIHYKKNDEQTWTPIPGVPMKVSDNSTYPTPPWFQFILEANSLEFLFNDGKGSWYHGPGGSNFKVSQSGIYGVKDFNIFVIIVYPKKCPGVPICTGHGKCVEGNCQCAPNYYGSACESFCDTRDHILCPGGNPGELTCVEGDKCPQKPLPGCQIFHDGSCQGREIDMPSDFEKRRWQTAPRNHPAWKPSFQDFSDIQGNAHVVYDSSRTSAEVELKLLLKNPQAQKPLTYTVNGAAANPPFKFDKSNTKGPVIIKVRDAQGHVLNLQPLDFMFNTHTPINLPGNYRNGQKGAIVEMFGWPDEDVEKECQLMSSAGYLGVRLSGHMEQLMSVQPFQDELNPWYFMYQPVSYNLNGRHGTRDDLRRLIQTCRKYNVRVYADAVINHMIGNGNCIQPHRTEQCVYWPGKNSTDNSPFFTQGFNYFYNEFTGQPPSQEFPSVPYGPMDFHCERALSSWTDPLALGAGWLTGLTDLHTGRENVRERIADYLTDLMGIGFSGFRVDAAKHISPDDLTAIFAAFRRNMGGNLPVDFNTWLEILVGGERDMLLCDEGSGYNYGKYFENKLRAYGFDDTDVLKVKLWASWYPNEPDGDCGKVDRRREVIQNDDHDQQNGGSSSRDMHDKGSVLVLDKDPAKHRGFEMRLFNEPFGVYDNENDWPIRLVLSSYYFPPNGAHAIPDGKSDCSLCKVTCQGCKTVTKVAASVPSAKAYDGSGGSMTGYTLVHRDSGIVDAMRRWMKI